MRRYISINYSGQYQDPVWIDSTSAKNKKEAEDILDRNDASIIIISAREAQSLAKEILARV